MRQNFRWTIIRFLFVLTFIFPPMLNISAQIQSAPAPASAYDLISAVNNLRASNGLPSYNTNSILMQIAQAQADYLASTGGVYGHIGPGGTRPFQRALAAGYPVAGDLSLGGLFSENWAAGQSVQDVIDMWMGDAPHRGTMLSSDLQDIGAGMSSDGNLNYYVIDCGLASGSPVHYQPPFGGTIEAGTGTPGTLEPTVAVVIVSTPDQNGNVYHMVEAGQTLWQIALGYKTTIDSIKRLNGLPSNSIFIGQKLLISRVGTPTPVPPTAKPTRDLNTPTFLPTFEIYTETPTGEPTKIPAAPATGHQGTITVAAIVLVALVAAGFISWAGRQKPL